MHEEICPDVGDEAVIEKDGDPRSVRHLRPDAMPPIHMGDVFVDEDDDQVGFLDKELSDLLSRLRVPFPDNEIEKRIGARGVSLDYIGHAGVTDRLLDVDLLWSWEPLALDTDGLPKFDRFGGLWIKLTVCGVTRLGYGDAVGKDPGTTAVKEIIGDAIRNAAMRFGVALALWSKIDRKEHAEVATRQEPTPNQKALDDLGAVCDENGLDRRTMGKRYRKWAEENGRVLIDFREAGADDIIAFTQHIILTATPDPDVGTEAGTVADQKSDGGTGAVEEPS